MFTDTQGNRVALPWQINSDVFKFENWSLQWSERKLLFYEHVQNHKVCISPHYSNLKQVGQIVHSVERDAVLVVSHVCLTSRKTSLTFCICRWTRRWSDSRAGQSQPHCQWRGSQWKECWRQFLQRQLHWVWDECVQHGVWDVVVAPLLKMLSLLPRPYSGQLSIISVCFFIHNSSVCLNMWIAFFSHKQE